MKKYILNKITTFGGKTLRVINVDVSPAEGKFQLVEATLLEALKFFVYSLDSAASAQKKFMTMDDSIQVNLLYNNLELSKDGVLLLSENDFNWLVPKVEEYAPQIFGVLHAVAVKEALQNYEK